MFIGGNSKTVAETIHDVTLSHLNNNGLILGQCLSAVGRINGTIPEHNNVIELPMTDVSGAGFAVGAALSGRRPIFVMRFQDFSALNCSPIVNYAAKVQELHDLSCPLFIRSIGAEGLGPVHSGVFHNIFMHYPGMSVWAPMTPMEYRHTWKSFIENDIPYYVSEHRGSYENKSDTVNVQCDQPHIVLIGIGIVRFEMLKAANQLINEGINCTIYHLYKLKPLKIENDLLEQLKMAGVGLVVDAGYEICGASRDVAYCLMEKTGAYIQALGLKDKTKCLRPELQNRYPDSTMIYDKVKVLLDGKRIPLYGMDTP